MQFWMQLLMTLIAKKHKNSKGGHSLFSLKLTIRVPVGRCHHNHTIIEEFREQDFQNHGISYVSDLRMEKGPMN